MVWLCSELPHASAFATTGSLVSEIIFQDVGRHPTLRPVAFTINDNHKFTGILRACLRCCQSEVTLHCSGEATVQPANLCEYHDMCADQLEQEWSKAVCGWVFSLAVSETQGTFQQDHAGKVVEFDHGEGKALLTVAGIPTYTQAKSQLGLLLERRWDEIFKLKHAEGCYHSSAPDVMVKSYTNIPLLKKTLHFKLCNGAYLNLEGLLVGMTAGRKDTERNGHRQQDDKWGTIQSILERAEYYGSTIGAASEDSGLIFKMFLVQAGSESQRLYRAIERLNGWNQTPRIKL